MTSTAIELTADRATVLFRPSWLGRLFGCREVVLELERVTRDGQPAWRTAGTHRWLNDLGSTMCERISTALDFRPRNAMVLVRDGELIP